MSALKFMVLFLFLWQPSFSDSINEWPNYSGPGYSSFSQSTLLKPPLRLKWVTRLTDNFKNGPVVAEGKVLCMGRTGNLFCLDAETGEILWCFSIKRNFIPGNFLGSYSYGTWQAPCIWQGKVYADFFWNNYPEVSGMYCFDLKSGSVLWRKTAGYTTMRARCSPAIVDGRLLFLCNQNPAPAVWQSQIQAWDALTGDSLWTCPLFTASTGNYQAQRSWQTVGHDTLFAVIGVESVMGRTFAVDKNGQLLWQDSVYSDDASTLGYHQGRVFVCRSADTTTVLNSSDGSFIRKDCSPGTGATDPVFTGNRYWRRTYGDSPKGYNINNGALELTCKSAPSITGCGNPTAANGYLYLGHGLTSGVTHSTFGHVLRAYDMVTGQVAWSFRMSSNVCTPPAVAYDRLYVTAGGDGDLIYCFENAD